MIKHIESDEVYPAYFFVEGGARTFPLELTEDEVAQVEQAWDAWDSAQALLRKRLEEQGAYDARGVMTSAWRNA